jgi:hypothetical protein
MVLSNIPATKWRMMTNTSTVKRENREAISLQRRFIPSAHPEGDVPIEKYLVGKADI